MIIERKEKIIDFKTKKIYKKKNRIYRRTLITSI